MNTIRIWINDGMLCVKNIHSDNLIVRSVEEGDMIHTSKLSWGEQVNFIHSQEIEIETTKGEGL